MNSNGTTSFTRKLVLALRAQVYSEAFASFERVLQICIIVGSVAKHYSHRQDSLLKQQFSLYGFLEQIQVKITKRNKTNA